jgi:hypothetical protein
MPVRANAPDFAISGQAKTHVRTSPYHSASTSLIKVASMNLPNRTENQTLAQMASARDPCRAGSEPEGGAKTAADSSPAGCVKNEEADESTFSQVADISKH